MKRLEPGDVLRGKYRIERVLGEGGMGVVLLATHLRLGQLVAIKTLKRSPSTSGGGDDGGDIAVRWFAREARAASRLRSEHCVRILDVDDSENGDPFLVMEYLIGRDLRRVIRAEAPLSTRVAVDYAIQACEGLAEAHAAAIVHRDLKPANLFVTTRPDGSPLVKILDFGISKLDEHPVDVDVDLDVGVDVGVDADANGGGAPRVTIGSPSYMSPEQIRNPHDVDARTDVWALGVVLYQMLSDALPFIATSSSPAGVVAQIASEPPRPLCEVQPSVPEELAAIIDQCLAKDRNARIKDVAILARALAPFGSGRLSSADRVARVIRAPTLAARISSCPPPLLLEHEREREREREREHATPDDCISSERSEVAAGNGDVSGDVEDSHFAWQTATMANTPAAIRRPWVQLIAAGLAERWSKRRRKAVLRGG